MAETDPIQAHAEQGPKEAKWARANKGGDDAIKEGDFQDRRALNRERVEDMRQARTHQRANHQQRQGIRKAVFRWAMWPFIFVSWLAMLLLLLAVYFPGIWGWFCNQSPFFLYIEKMGTDGESVAGSAWPLGAFILGTFISFAAVFSALAFGVFASLRDKGDESPARNMLNMVQGKQDNDNG